MHNETIRKYAEDSRLSDLARRNAEMEKNRIMETTQVMVNQANEEYKKNNGKRTGGDSYNARPGG